MWRWLDGEPEGLVLHDVRGAHRVPSAPLPCRISPDPVRMSRAANRRSLAERDCLERRLGGVTQDGGTDSRLGKRFDSAQCDDQ